MTAASEVRAKAWKHYTGGLWGASPSLAVPPAERDMAEILEKLRVGPMMLWEVMMVCNLGRFEARIRLKALERLGKVRHEGRVWRSA